MIVQTTLFNAQVAAKCLQMLFNVEHQNLIQLRHGFGGPIVLTHQHFAGPLGVFALGGAFCLVAKTLGQDML